jgi:hypothetical protein
MLFVEALCGLRLWFWGAAVVVLEVEASSAQLLQRPALCLLGMAAAAAAQGELLLLQLVVVLKAHCQSLHGLVLPAPAEPIVLVIH